MAQIGLNKVNYTRFTTDKERGYDIMTNKKFDHADPESKKLFEP